MKKTDHEIRLIIIGLACIGLAIYLLTLLGGCEECRPNAVRCAGDVREVCDGDGRWYRETDCGDYIGLGAVWVCCELDAGPECVPELECGDE